MRRTRFPDTASVMDGSRPLEHGSVPKSRGFICWWSWPTASRPRGAPRPPAARPGSSDPSGRRPARAPSTDETREQTPNRVPGRGRFPGERRLRCDEVGHFQQLRPRRCRRRCGPGQSDCPRRRGTTPPSSARSASARHRCRARAQSPSCRVPLAVPPASSRRAAGAGVSPRGRRRGPSAGVSLRK